MVNMFEVIPKKFCLSFPMSNSIILHVLYPKKHPDLIVFIFSVLPTQGFALLHQDALSLSLPDVKIDLCVEVHEENGRKEAEDDALRDDKRRATIVLGYNPQKKEKKTNFFSQKKNF
jgi:hypothetical protein